MKTQIIRINPHSPDIDKIKHAAQALKNGRLVVFPTETVYGIGANIDNKSAMARLAKLKERENKPFSLHIAKKTDLNKLDCIVTNQARKLIKEFWPGPLTLVFNTKSGGAIGVRMPQHPVALELLKRAGAPVVAPSANFKGKKPATSAKDAIRELNGFVDIIIDSGKTNTGMASTVLDLTQTPPKILRKGAVTKKEIERIIGSTTNNKAQKTN